MRPGGRGRSGIGRVSEIGVKRRAGGYRWRRGGTVPRLVAGPNVAVLPNDGGGVVAAPEVDLCLLPSDWVRQLFEDEEPALSPASRGGSKFVFIRLKLS